MTAAPVVQSALLFWLRRKTKREAVKAPAPGAASGYGFGHAWWRCGAHQEAAKAEWRRLQTKFRNQLGNLTVNVQKADLGARGIYWRIQGGPVSEAENGSVDNA